MTFLCQTRLSHQQEPLSPILRLGVNPFPIRFVYRTALKRGFAHKQFKDPIKTELDKVYCYGGMCRKTIHSI